MQIAFEDTQTVSVPGADLAVVQKGSGTPVVFIHGGVSDIRTWSRQISDGLRDHRLIAYSRRYARPNPEIADGIDDQMQVHVDDLQNLLPALDAAPAHLVGHSWGGFIALLSAIQFPDSVRSLTLIEPPVLSLFLDLPPRIPQVLALLMKSPATAFAILKLGGTVMARAERAFRDGDDLKAIRIFGQGVLGPDRFAQMSSERYQQVLDNLKTEKAQMLGSGYPRLTEHDVRAVHIPTMLLVGSESPQAFLKMAQRLATLMPHATLKEIAGASHIVHEDQPQEFAATLQAFLDGQNASN